MTMRARGSAADAPAGGIREILNRHARLTAGAVGLAVVACLAVSLWPEAKPEAYYTVDDGKTFFAAGPNIPPFQHQGKEAVKAIVVSCDGGQTRFVGYLFRYTPEGRKKAEEDMRTDRFAPASGFEVKRPGDAEWVAPFDPTALTAEKVKAGALAAGKKYDEVTRVRCKDGKGAITYLPE